MGAAVPMSACATSNVGIAAATKFPKLHTQNRLRAGRYLLNDPSSPTHVSPTPSPDEDARKEEGREVVREERRRSRCEPYHEVAELQGNEAAGEGSTARRQFSCTATAPHHCADQDDQG
jgi:hypothetical protein